MSDLDDFYRDRAHLIALLAWKFPAVRTPSTDTEPGWWTVFIYVRGRQLTWHISPADVDLLGHIEIAPTWSGDTRTVWDGHSTAEKYQRIRELVGIAA